MLVSADEGELRGDKVDRSPISQSAEEQRVADINWNRYIRARDNGHIEFIASAKKNDDFYRGDQWDPQDLAKLACSGRPALTINTILPTINTVLGEQANKRAQVQFKPKRASSQQSANTLNQLYNQISDINEYDWKESQVFADGLIQDRGYFDVRIDYSKNVQGEVRISMEDPLNIVLDPDAKAYDPDTWYEFFKTKWASLDDIELVFGEDKADLLRNYVDQGQYYGADSIEVHENRFGEFNIHPTDFHALQTGSLPEHEIRAIRAVRLIERQHKVVSQTDFFVDMMTGDLKLCPETWDEERCYAFAQQHKLSITKRQLKRIRWTVSVDRVLLHDSWSPYDQFTIVPYFPYFRRGKPFGMVCNLISPQEQLNKVSSQELHVVNTTANSGWKVPTGALVNMTLDELEQRGAETGLVIQYNPAAGEPLQIQPNPVPAGLDRISMKSAMHIKEISGVSDALLGQETPEISGAAIMAKQSRGQVQMQVPLDNLAQTRKIIADRVLSLIQQFYTEERVYYISNDSFGITPEEPEYKQIVINQKMASGEIVNNITLGDYEVKVSSTPAKDVFHETQFEEALQMRTAGIMIPDDALVQYSNLSHKYELAERIRQASGQGKKTPEQEQQEQMMMEIQMQQIKLELAQLTADVEKTQADTAETLESVEIEKRKIELEHQIDLMKIQIDAQKAIAAGSTSLRTTAMKAQTELGKAAMDNKTRLITSQIRARNDAKNKAKTPTRK